MKTLLTILLSLSVNCFATERFPENDYKVVAFCLDSNTKWKEIELCLATVKNSPLTKVEKITDKCSRAGELWEATLCFKKAGYKFEDLTYEQRSAVCSRRTTDKKLAECYTKYRLHRTEDRILKAGE